MRILSKVLERDGSGTVSVIPDCDEDLYHLYNLIQPEDLVSASTVRRIQSESSTGSIESHRMRLQLTLSVTKIDLRWLQAQVCQAPSLHLMSLFLRAMQARQPRRP